jgi:beta-1,2-xylosyltransferase
MSFPFALPVNIPVPRRVLVLGISVLSCITIFYLFSPSASLSATPITEFSPGKWLPTIPSPFGQDYPDEWDEDGQCLFLSPFDALSTEEKERASQLVLEAVSTGIVKSSNASLPEHVVPEPLRDVDEYGPAGKNPAHHGGMTNPIIGLLRDGERKWQDLVARQSKTLEQAVDEYRARWNREPPKGFGEW